VVSADGTQIALRSYRPSGLMRSDGITAAGLYIGQCPDCGWQTGTTTPVTPDGVYIRGLPGPAGMFTVRILRSAVRLVGGIVVALRHTTGALVSRCSGCLSAPAVSDSAVAKDSGTGASYDQYTVVQVGDSRNHQVALLADDGTFMERGVAVSGGGAGLTANSLNVMAAGAELLNVITFESTQVVPAAVWTVVRLGGGRVALRSDTGRFLGMCDTCQAAGWQTAYPNPEVVGFGNPWDTQVMLEVVQVPGAVPAQFGAQFAAQAAAQIQTVTQMQAAAQAQVAAQVEAAAQAQATAQAQFATQVEAAVQA